MDWARMCQSMANTKKNLVWSIHFHSHNAGIHPSFKSHGVVPFDDYCTCKILYKSLCTKIFARTSLYCLELFLLSKIGKTSSYHERICG